MPHQILPFKADISQLWWEPACWGGFNSDLTKLTHLWCVSACRLDSNLHIHMVGDVQGDQVCKLDGGCCAADSDWNSTEVWVVHRPLVWALILYTQGSSGPRWFSIAAVIQLPGRQTCTAPKTHNNQPELEISSHSAVLSAVWPSHYAASGPCDLVLKFSFLTCVSFHKHVKFTMDFTC